VQERQGWVPPAAGGEASRNPPRDRSEQHAARARRALAEVACENRHQDGDRSLAVRRQRPGIEGVQAAAVGTRLDRRLSGRRQFRPAALRTERGTKQPGVLRIEGVRKVLQCVAIAAAIAGGQPALPRDDAADGGRRGLVAAHLARAQRSHPAMDPGLQEASDPSGRVAVSRRNPALIRMARRFIGLSLAIFVAFAVFAPAASAADMNKVIRHVFPAGEEGFDPAAAHDLYSGPVEQAIFETLLTYDYLARPSKLVPLTAEAMPEVSDKGQTYTIKLKKGIYFTLDPAFKGVKRELRDADYVYSWKRLMDPAIHSPWTWLLDGKIVGLDEQAEKAKKGGKFDYAAKVAGLEVVDKYTLRIRLKQPDYNLPYVLAHEPMSAVAHEVIAAYG